MGFVLEMFVVYILKKMGKKDKNNIMARHSSQVPDWTIKMASFPGIIINSGRFRFQKCSGLDVNYITTILWEVCIIWL